MKYATAVAFRMALDRRIANTSGGNQLRIQWHRRRIAFDRIVARIEASAPGEFLLKGGLALHLRYGERARDTYDMDLSAHGLDRVYEIMRGLATVDLGDFFSVRVANEPDKPLLCDRAIRAYRWSLEAVLDGKRFERCTVDVGIGEATPSEQRVRITTQPILEFAEIVPSEISVVSLERHIAEKIHAYVQARGTHENTRVKDLVDLALLYRMAPNLSVDAIQNALRLTFAERGTPIPTELPTPPAGWHSRYEKVAGRADVPGTLEAAFAEARAFLEPVLWGIASP